MHQRDLSSIREVVGLTLSCTLALFLLAEIVLAQDALFFHPVVVLAVFSIALIVWYWG